MALILRKYEPFPEGYSFCLT